MSPPGCQLPTLPEAGNTVFLTIQSGIPVARIELRDGVQMDACIRYSKLKGYDAKPTLWFEFHGTEASVSEQAEMVGAIAEDFGGGGFQWTKRTEERNQLWQARHDAYFAALALQPGKKGIATDACVPISRLAECLLDTQRDIQESGMVAPIVGHVGDGNFHLVILIDPDKPEELKQAKALIERMNYRAIAMGGTCTGEHGIGLGKKDFLTAKHGEAGSVMRSIKQSLDPSNIMNPGKMLRM